MPVNNTACRLLTPTPCQCITQLTERSGKGYGVTRGTILPPLPLGWAPPPLAPHAPHAPNAVHAAHAANQGQLEASPPTSQQYTKVGMAGHAHGGFGGHAQGGSWIDRLLIGIWFGIFTRWLHLSSQSDHAIIPCHCVRSDPDATTWALPGTLLCSQVYVGVGRAAMSRTEMFRVEHGVAVSMEHPLFRVPSVQGAWLLLSVTTAVTSCCWRTRWQALQLPVLVLVMCAWVSECHATHCRLLVRVD